MYPLNVNVNGTQSNAFRISYILVQPSSWAQVQILSVSSTSSCTTQGNVSINCAFPATVTIQTTGWGQLNLAFATLIVTGPDGTELGGFGSGVTLARSSLDLGSNTTLQATIFPQAYTPSLVASAAGALAPLLNLTLRSWQAGGSSTVGFPGISFAYDAGPTLTSISGCTGSGAATTNCVPATAVLTFQGSGFSWFSNPGAVQLWLNTGYTTVAGQGGGQGGQPALTVISDSMMTLNLANAYTYTLLPIHYGGVLVPIFFNEQRWSWPASGYVNSYTNALQISFIPQPAPNVTLVTTNNGPNGCQGTNGSFPLHQLHPAGVVHRHRRSVHVRCSRDCGGLCMPFSGGAVGRAGALPPPCAEWRRALRRGDQRPHCPDHSLLHQHRRHLVHHQPHHQQRHHMHRHWGSQPAGLLLWWHLQRGHHHHHQRHQLPMGDTGVVVTATWNPPGNPNQRPPWGQSAIPVTLTSASIISTTQITATLPYLASLTGASSNASLAFYGNNVQLRVSFTSQPATNNLNLQLYAVPNAPAVSSITGCAVSNSALQLSNCVSGSTLTITGTNLGNPGFGGPFVGPVTNGGAQWICSVTSSSATQILCTLPTFDPQVSSRHLRHYLPPQRQRVVWHSGQQLGIVQRLPPLLQLRQHLQLRLLLRPQHRRHRGHRCGGAHRRPGHHRGHRLYDAQREEEWRRRG